MRVLFPSFLEGIPRLLVHHQVSIDIAPFAADESLFLANREAAERFIGMFEEVLEGLSVGGLGAWLEAALMHEGR